MISGLSILLVIFLAIVCMVLAISRSNQHPLTALMATTIAVGLVCRTPIREVINTVKSGFGNILASIGIVILAGAIIGTILEETGIALTVASTVLKLIGKKSSVLTTAITGYATNVLVFCDSGFVILGSISKAPTSQSNVSLAVMVTALSDGLYAARRLVPPTSGSITMAGIPEADLGLIILVGLLVSILATLLVLFYAKRVSDKIGIPADPEYTMGKLLQRYNKLPDAFHSLSPILFPIVLTALKSVGDFPSALFGDGVIKTLFSFVGNPVIALILGVPLATTLVPAVKKENTLSWTTESVTNSAGILTITGTGGAFGVILQRLPITDTLSASFLGLGVGIFLPFIITALLKTTMGASTAAMIIISAMIVPLMSALGFTTSLAKVLVIMAIGASSMIVSHANDFYFWVVSWFSDIGAEDVYKYQTGMTDVMGTMTIIIVFILSPVFCGAHS